MAKKSEMRDLPISLQGIETILLYLDEKNKETSSIRNISDNTGISMRVVKNILLQLEKFNQIERFVEKNNILPKWRITKFGRRVVKEAKGTENHVEFPSKEAELMHNIKIPEDSNVLKDSIKEKQELILLRLKDLQVELSKNLGPILNIDNPIFENLISLIIKQIKQIKQKVVNLPFDPLSIYRVKKKGQKERSWSKSEEKILFIEIFFVNSLLLNEINHLDSFNNKLTQFLENEAYIRAYSVAKDLREEIRTLKHMICLRESVGLDSHILSEDAIKQIAKNKITAGIIDELLEERLSDENKPKVIEESILSIIGKIKKDLIYITENVPLYEFYHLILDENPSLDISIKELEQAIEQLADEGHILGIKLIQADEDNYLKVVQLKPSDINKNETELIAKALTLEAFALSDMVNATGWSTEQVLKILEHLTEIGILKFSESLLHGKRWYIVSENTN